VNFTKQECPKKSEYLTLCHSRLGRPCSLRKARISPSMEFARVLNCSVVSWTVEMSNPPINPPRMATSASTGRSIRNRPTHTVFVFWFVCKPASSSFPECATNVVARAPIANPTRIPTKPLCSKRLMSVPERIFIQHTCEERRSIKHGGNTKPVDLMVAVQTGREHRYRSLTGHDQACLRDASSARHSGVGSLAAL
jgi:hypothetical protein